MKHIDKRRWTAVNILKEYVPVVERILRAHGFEPERAETGKPFTDRAGRKWLYIYYDSEADEPKLLEACKVVWALTPEKFYSVHGSVMETLSGRRSETEQAVTGEGWERRIAAKSAMKVERMQRGETKIFDDTHATRDMARLVEEFLKRGD